MAYNRPPLHELAVQFGGSLSRGSMPAMRHIHMQANTNIGVLFRHQANVERSNEFMTIESECAEAAVKLWQADWRAKNPNR